MRLRKTVSIILLVILLSVLSFPAYAADELLVNPSLEGEGVPEGWTVLSYLSEGFSVSSQDGEVILTCLEANDLRLLQTVEVEENTVYTLRAQAAAANVLGGKGVSLSIDNYSVDGCYIYSHNIIGSSDWTDMELVFRTGEGQTLIRAALRLGGYSELSTGTVRFRNVSLTKSSDSSGALSLARNETVQDHLSSDDPGQISEMRRYQLKSYLHLFLVAAIFSACIMVFGVYRNRERIGSVQMTDTDRRRFFILAVMAGFVLRSLLASAWGGHDSDMSCWMGWGNYIARNGTAEFYTAPGHEWYDYPPGYMLVLGLIARIVSVLRIPESSGAAVFAYMLPAYFADIAGACLVMRWAGKKGFSNGWQLMLGCLCIFNPAAVVLSGAWGQIDSILTLLLLLSFTELTLGRRISAGAIFGLAVMVKWQALIYGPVLAAAYIFHLRSKKDVRDTFLGVLAAFCVILAVSLPFKGSQGILWFVSRFFSAAGGYDYASVEAYNFLALCGGNWKSASASLIPGISFKTVGTVFILLTLSVCLYLQYRESVGMPGKKLRRDDSHILFLSAALCMYGIFTFGHYMHERYVFPVMLLLVFIFLFTKEPRFLLCSMLLSSVLFLNEMTAMFVISRLASSVVRGVREHNAVVAACSAMETLSFFYFTTVTWDHVISFERGGGADA